MPGMPSRVQTDAERRRREAGVEQSIKIRSRSCRFVGGWLSGYVGKWVCMVFGLFVYWGLRARQRQSSICAQDGIWNYLAKQST